MNSLVDGTGYLSTNEDLNADTIGMIIGVALAFIALLLLFVFFAYFLPWLILYEQLCFLCPAFIDCVRLVNACSYTKTIAYRKWSSYRPTQIFQQQIIQNVDGSIIEANRMEPINTLNQSKLVPQEI